MKKLLSLFSFIVIGLLLIGCERNLTSSDDELELDPVLAEQATFGWEVTRVINTGQEIEGLTLNSQNFEKEGIGDVPNIDNLKNEASRMFDDTKPHLLELDYLAKPRADSLYIYIDDTVKGVRIALYYNSIDGLATYYEVKYKFAGWRQIVYDSITVTVDVGFTLNDPHDDVLKSLFRQQLYESKFFVQKINSSLVVTHHDGTEITGAEATNDAYYHPDRFLTRLRRYWNLNPEESGTLREDFEFRDGTTSYNSVTFFTNNTGEFSKQLRDGTIITGTFDSVEDDLQGSYTETIDYPEGRNVDKVIKSAHVSLTLPDSIFHAEFSETVHFRSGRVESANIELESQEISGNKITTLAIQKANGAHGSFTVEEYDEEATLVGEWTTWNDYYITLQAEKYFDGSVHIHYQVFAPPYNENDTPIIIADYYLSPDASGNGTISYDGEVYQVTSDGSTQAEIALDDKKTIINLFQ